MKSTLNDQLTLHRIGLGAMPLSIIGRPSESDSIKIIHDFIDRGGNLIDTADVYGIDHADMGHNEKLIAKALKQLKVTNRVILATKGGATRPNGGWALGGGHPKKLRHACESSLMNLEVAEHAIYYLHGPDREIPMEDSLGELIRLKNEGKIRQIAIANVTLNNIKLACKMTNITAVQNRCNTFCKTDLNNGVTDFCQANKIMYVPYCPLGGWSDHRELMQNKAYNHLVQKYQVSSYIISLAWLLSKGDNILPIPGMDQIVHIKANLSSVDIKLTDEDISIIDDFPNLYPPIHLDS